jgi:hypothetical protein
MIQRKLEDIVNLQGKRLSEVKGLRQRASILELIIKLEPFKEQIEKELDADIIILNTGHVIINGFKDVKLAQKLRALVRWEE